MDLNARQNEAVLYLDGPCLVLAGAGSGKTRVITRKMAYLLRECGYQARHVVALTFTNKAAREMNERVRTLVEARLLRGLTVGTFHSLGLRFLREEALHLGLKRGFSILDATDAQGIIQELLATTDRARLRAVQQTISLWKNALLDPDAAARQAQGADEAEAVRVFRSYEATLRAYQAVDFDDLIRMPAQLLQQDEAVRERWQARVQYLLVDEYQDTNACQYQLVRLLCGDRAMLTAVGDDDQAIYAWRGATVENLAQLERDYPRLRVIKLEQNYRSVQRILQAANQVISHNPKTFDKTLWSELGTGEPIGITPMGSDLIEAESIAMRISASRFERQAQWKDFAVLYRGNHQARVMEQALRTLRIPYTVSGGQSFFRQGRNPRRAGLAAPGGQRGRRPRLHPCRHHPAPWYWPGYAASLGHRSRASWCIAVRRGRPGDRRSVACAQTTSGSAVFCPTDPAFSDPGRTPWRDHSGAAGRCGSRGSAGFRSGFRTRIRTNGGH